MHTILFVETIGFRRGRTHRPPIEILIGQRKLETYWLAFGARNNNT